MICLVQGRVMSLVLQFQAAQGCPGGARSPISFCFLATTAFHITAKDRIQPAGVLLCSRRSQCHLSMARRVFPALGTMERAQEGTTGSV